MRFVNIMSFLYLTLCLTALNAQPQYYGNPMENLPPWVTRLTHFGQRADWSHDGKKVLFIEKTHGDAYEIDIESKIMSPVTHHFPHGGFTRALYLSNGDILLSGSMHFDAENARDYRFKYAALWVLDKSLQKPPTPLGTYCFEGPAVSRSQLKIAWVVSDEQYPAKLDSFQFILKVADIEYDKNNQPRLANEKIVFDNKKFGSKIRQEPQNFIPQNEDFITMTTGFYQGSEVFKVNINDGSWENMTNKPDDYDEPEGIFPGGEYSLIETDRHKSWGVHYIDIYKLKLDGSGNEERLTFSNDYEGYKSSNPVVRDDGKMMAYQIAHLNEAPGIGHGIMLFDIDMYEDYKKYGKWEIVPASGEPDPRHEASFIGVNDNFYLLGGREIKPINIFNPETQTWTNGKKPPMELHHFQAVKMADKIYVMGAQTGKFPNEVPVENIWIYNTLKDEWVKGDEIPEKRRRGASGCSVYNGKIYLSGGIIDGHNGGHVLWFDEYDPATGKWVQLQDIPRVRDHFHSAVHNHKLYLLGGRKTSRATGHTFSLTIPQVDVYDFKTKKWSTLPDSLNLPTTRAGQSVISVKDQIYVIGGESESKRVAHAEVEVYHPKTQNWIRYPSLKQGRHGTQSVFYKGFIYVASGSGNRGGGPELKTIERYKVPKK